MAVQICNMASSKSLTQKGKASTGKSYLAKPFKGKTEAELNKYIDNEWQEFVTLKFYDEEVNWNVYILCKSFFGHYSMLFLRKGFIEGFLIHLLVNEDDETEFHLDTVNLRSLSRDCPDLKALSLGTTNEFTAKYIITTAHNTLVSLGYYHAVLNNCQDYCKEIAAKIKVSDKFTNWKDALLAEVFGGSASLITAAATIGVGIGVGIATTISASRSGMHHTGLQSTCGLLTSVKELYKKYRTTTR